MTNADLRMVAIVDDDYAVRDSLKFLLEIAGYTVAAFASAADFLRSDMQQMACLILDHHMPHMTGLQLAEQLRTDGVTMPILLITGSPSPDLSNRAARLGVQRVLEKPPSEEELFQFVEAAMA